MNNTWLKNYNNRERRYVDRRAAYKFVDYYREQLIKHDTYSCHPLWVGIKVTSECNCNCIHCWVEKKSYLPTLEEILSGLEKLKKLGVLHVTISGGEPFVRKDILKILKCVKKYRFHLEIFTNAILLQEDLVKELSDVLDRKNDLIQISFDAANRETYLKQRSKDEFDKVIKNIKLLQSYGINIRLNFTATPINQNEIVETFELAKKLNVKAFSVSHVFDLNKGESIYEQVDDNLYIEQIKKCIELSKQTEIEFRAFIPVEEYAKYYQKTQKRNAKIKYYILDWFIHSDGSIYPDVTLENNEFLLGNIYKDSIDMIIENIKKKKNILFYRNLENTCCESCNQFELCFGGERGRAYKWLGTVDKPDPRCAIYQKE